MAKRIQPEGPKPITVLIILLLCILLLGALFAAIKVFLMQQGTVMDTGSIEVFFCQAEPCEELLIRELEESDASFCAFYELNLNRTIATLATESTRLLLFDEEAHKTRGVAYEPVPSRGLMHHKFCVLDPGMPDARVITGSMNPTLNDAYRNDNNIAIIRSGKVATEYLDEFRDLSGRAEGRERQDRAKPLIVDLSGTIIELRFCPEDDCEAAVLDEVRNAKDSVRFMTFSFTSDPIGTAVLAAHDRGVDVEGVFERRQIDQWSEYHRLSEWGVPVLLDGNARTMHHKVLIIDNRTVVTGSYNPTKSANERNDENLLIIHSPRIAAEYLEEYARVRSAAS